MKSPSIPFDKRLFDVFFAILLMMIFAPLFCLVLIVMLILEGRPLFYPSERMKTPSDSFILWKLRSMRSAGQGAPEIAGGNLASRISPLGSFLRRSRLDELPQLWNILKGDMSFVGPRPELRKYVEAYPDHYIPVLQCRPGVTGLATIVFHRHEDFILQSCQTAEQTHAAYVRRCIPRKSRLDQIYAQHQSVCFDAWLGMRSSQRMIRW